MLATLSILQGDPFAGLHCALLLGDLDRRRAIVPTPPPLHLRPMGELSVVVTILPKFVSKNAVKTGSKKGFR